MPPRTRFVLSVRRVPVRPQRRQRNPPIDRPAERGAHPALQKLSHRSSADVSSCLGSHLQRCARTLCARPGNEWLPLVEPPSDLILRPRKEVGYLISGGRLLALSRGIGGMCKRHAKEDLSLSAVSASEERHAKDVARVTPSGLRDRLLPPGLSIQFPFPTL